LFGQTTFNLTFCCHLHHLFFNCALFPGGRFSNSPTSQSPVRCTKGEPSEPFVQRAAAAPQLQLRLFKIPKKNPRFAQFFFGTSQSHSALAVRLKDDTTTDN
jgi:hypothetical protein